MSDKSINTPLGLATLVKEIFKKKLNFFAVWAL